MARGDAPERTRPGGPHETVLVVAPPEDAHAAAVVPRLRALGADVARLELAPVARDVSLSLAYGSGGPPRFALREGGTSLDPSGCAAVWWWRPGRITADESLPPALRQLAVREHFAALAGLWHAISPRWVNDPVRHDVASRKTLQLAVARGAGLGVPRTLVTNDAGDARRFLETCRPHGRVDAVQKTLTPFAEDLGFTRRLEPADLDRLDALRCAPAILQEYVDGPDLRVIAVGPSLFAMELDARASAHPEDCRRDWEHARGTARAAELPAEVARGIVEVMARLGLVYGAFDLRRRERDGEYLFLEVNPAGQWLYVEEATGQPITAAVAGLLAGRPASLARAG